MMQRAVAIEKINQCFQTFNVQIDAFIQNGFRAEMNQCRQRFQGDRGMFGVEHFALA